MSQSLKPKKKAGQPSAYKAEYCETVIAMAKQGKTLAGIAKHIGVARQSLYEWENVHKEFSDALAKARTISESYYEDMAIQAMQNPHKRFNTELWKFWMKARFRWTEPQDVRQETTHRVDPNAADLAKELLEAARAAAENK